MTQRNTPHPPHPTRPADGTSVHGAAPHPDRTDGSSSPHGVAAATTSRTHALAFDSVASQYAAARPGYPAALYDTLEELTGRPLKGSLVVDVGAGTGIATRALRDRGARIVAVEPGHAMADELRRALPGVPLLRAAGDALPLADGTADLVTYAQAWHWTDPARSVPEAFRVLARPHGALALWWNVPDPDMAWTRAQEARLADRLPGYHAHGVTTEAARIIRGLDPGLAPVYRRLHWTRRVSLDTHLANLGSRSYFAAIGREAAAPVLADERGRLLELFPDETVEEAYALDLTVTLHAS
ncbi:class I SAM-dependent methyltransferase [Streptomyces formicae]|uniref:Methyltransferase domain-containing protein n=1 Tax=Streptomyces formicae TaxID=1616117 RepID=A0ABY3WL65_9ACTN|nr:class I SAM-dependent methyltransferase [Streptomyces formicae]UNM10583.1 methyltransferase domain-containing protein [Streptomyces formicae]